MPGKKMRSIHPKRRRTYERLKKKGHSKSSAAAIANAGKTKAGRRRMARKAAHTRKRRGR